MSNTEMLYYNDPKKTYVATEPEQVTVYADVEGDRFDTREEAIASNFRIDLVKACEKHAPSLAANYNPWDVADVLEALAKEEPDMLRVLLGDRDAT